MCFKLALFALACVGGLTAQPVEFKPKREVPRLNDLEVAETEQGNPLEAIHAGSKYFQDIYVAQEKPNELQFGHVAENPTNWEQRFEKINLDSLQRQGKVRWGDKDGGYGEHYYDYNHDGHQKAEDDGEETENKPRYAAQETNHQPRYITRGVQVRQPLIATPESSQRGKREQGLLKDVEFINDKARSLILDGNSQKHGGNYRRADDYRGKREQHIVNEEDLVFESDKGTFLDQRTGIEYELKPLYH